MKAPTLIPIDEYLTTHYQPDCEYVDGELQERNLGEKDHSKIQSRLDRFFGALEHSTRLRVWPELRVQVKPTRFRAPDVCVTIDEPAEQILTAPPFIVVEVLSPLDSVSRLMEKVQDYWEFGVRHIWIVDPASRCGYTASTKGLVAVDTFSTDEPEITLVLSQLFQ